MVQPMEACDQLTAHVARGKAPLQLFFRSVIFRSAPTECFLISDSLCTLAGHTAAAGSRLCLLLDRGPPHN